MMIGLLVALAIGALIMVVTALRNPVLFKMGVRNITRRPAQTIADRSRPDADDAAVLRSALHRRHDELLDPARAPSTSWGRWMRSSG